MNTQPDTTSDPTNRTKPYTVSEAARAIGVSRHHLYRMVKKRELECIRLGRKMLIPARVVFRILDGGSE